jgi:predicted transcriptional regulator
LRKYSFISTSGYVTACICSNLVDELGLAQATISQHLKELKNIGVIQGPIEGKSVRYCLDKKIWKTIKKEFDTFSIKM